MAGEREIAMNVLTDCVVRASLSFSWGGGGGGR